MNTVEKVKKIRDITMSPFKNINEALAKSNGDVDGAIKILLESKVADANDMANRNANNSIVYSYVHNNKIGAMIVLSCQTDFVARNELFIQLAKDICMHIVSSPIQASFIDETDIGEARWHGKVADFFLTLQNDKKPQEIKDKIIKGKMDKWASEVCLLNQKFVKDDTKTVKELIQTVSGTVGEKIELRKFIRFSTSEIPTCREDGKH